LIILTFAIQLFIFIQKNFIMKNFLLLFFFAFILNLYCYGQESKNPNRFRNHSLYAEAGGNGEFFSLNYEFRLSINKDAYQAVYLRTGYGVSKDLVLPFELGFTMGKKSMLDLALGTTYKQVKGEPSILMFPLRVGYRFLGNNGFLLRMAPMIVFDQYLGANLWLGLSVGYSF